MNHKSPFPRQPRPPKKKDPLITGMVIVIIVTLIALGVVLYLA